METMMSVLVGILVTVATYLILSKSLLRVILGTAIMSHAVHLLIMIMGGFSRDSSAPLLGEEAASYTDALPQALILTAIVISFGVTSFFLVLAYRTYKELKTDDLTKLRGHDNDE
ncbi:Na(+) H(+) antiporter subunit C [Bacillus sp. JCM 19046]|uniref:Multicomponent Na+:H+ antiporter subunit C n=1 Tax=Shouchella xiaoxiensis TaxID=766895 RepID=A0ABS2ST34_9BACI|nr:Na(+)/H(+) antiporter subunit C [Shouchella xiaoxiensis]MBM7838657.1 multicomponent Na+:H+ antiporter subunit C [Shouchella xiaoxiensis]GAF11804.1 Na(+) H(+) antiporter subunit C [Bacillus sp. JCM 19045]GAF16099.1 Na(+) H(+) antiporter subunit C [Bacillus sp. JCM 19046]